MPIHRRQRCARHGLHVGDACPSCVEIDALRRRAEGAEALVAWLKPSWRAWRAAAREGNARLRNLTYGHPVALPRETPPDELLTVAERLAPAIAAKREEIRQLQARRERGVAADDFEDYLDDVNGASGYSRASTVESRERYAADLQAERARLEAELAALVAAAGEDADDDV